ncbi:unnamed protein product [Gadus morhua 'NCC']
MGGVPAPLGTGWGSERDLTDASQPLELTQPDAIEASLLEGPDEAEGGYSESGGGDLLASALTRMRIMNLFSPASRRLWWLAVRASLNPAVSMDLHRACKRAAARLNIEWPEPPVETATSRYEGKRHHTCVPLPQIIIH